MREIKFRAWHIKEKVMYTICEISFMKDSSDVFHERGCEGYFGDNHRGRFSLDDIKLMQFTGLKDKNGKEIYEGDIINDKISEKNFKIVFNNYGYWEGVGKNFHIVTALGMAREESCLEVIGNIYENSKLLELQNDN